MQFCIKVGVVCLRVSAVCYTAKEMQPFMESLHFEKNGGYYTVCFCFCEQRELSVFVFGCFYLFMTYTFSSSSVIIKYSGAIGPTSVVMLYYHISGYRC